MSETHRLAVFISDQFAPFLPDEKQVNPNVLGFELAAWLARELAAAGVVTSYPAAEDWGWYLEQQTGGIACLLACTGEMREPAGPYEWRIFATPAKRMFRKVDAAPAEALFDAAVKVLGAHGIEVAVLDE